jgi:hypothetical protein
MPQPAKAWQKNIPYLMSTDSAFLEVDRFSIKTWLMRRRRIRQMLSALVQRITNGNDDVRICRSKFRKPNLPHIMK